ncbi:uncharacterized protein DS421_14g467810 [Arachis hypogaea]|nr:uncharacterized protein DS421_14g467810 [Arachis hypogaea]
MHTQLHPFPYPHLPTKIPSEGKKEKKRKRKKDGNRGRKERGEKSEAARWVSLPPSPPLLAEERGDLREKESVAWEPLRRVTAVGSVIAPPRKRRGRPVREGGEEELFAPPPSCHLRRRHHSSRRHHAAPPSSSSRAAATRMVVAASGREKEPAGEELVAAAAMASLPSPWLGSHRREPSLSAPPSGLPPLLPPENTSAATEIYRHRRCRSSGRRCRSRWLPELPPNRFSDRRCFIFLVWVVF